MIFSLSSTPHVYVILEVLYIKYTFRELKTGVGPLLLHLAETKPYLYFIFTVNLEL